MERKVWRLKPRLSEQSPQANEDFRNLDQQVYAFKVPLTAQAFDGADAEIRRALQAGWLKIR